MTEITLQPIEVNESTIRHDRVKITDPNYKLTKKDHGKVLKVGKKNFVRIAIKGEFPWWEHGYVGVAELPDGRKIYKSKNGSWYIKYGK